MEQIIISFLLFFVNNFICIIIFFQSGWRRDMLKIMLISCILIWTVACTTYDEQYSGIFKLYYHNSLQQATQQIDSELQSMSPSDDDRPLLLLERASTALATGDFNTAVTCLQTADNITEILDLTDDPREVGKYLFTDTAGLYRIQPHEQIQLNTFGMISYLATGDLQNASVELKRAKSQEDYWVNRADQLSAKNALVQLLGASIAWHSGKRGDANFFKKQLQEVAGSSAEELLGKFPQEGEKELLILILNGQAPVRRETRQHVAGSAAVRLATSTGFTGDTIIYPRLERRQSPFQNAEVMIDGQSQGNCINVLDIEEQAINWFEQNEDKIMLAAASRMAVRATASSAAAYGTYAATKDSDMNEETRRSLAMLAGAWTNLAMQAVDRADTRCWTLLPQNVLACRIVGKLPEQTKLTIRLTGQSSRTISQTVKLDRSLNVVVLITPSSNVCYPSSVKM